MSWSVRLVWILVLGACPAVVVGCASTHDLYFIKGARVADASPVVENPDLEDRQDGQHRIEADSKVVLLMRDWERGDWFNMEDQEYRKLTVELPAVTNGQTFDAQTPGVAIFYSEGRTGWMWQRCGGTVASGTIAIGSYSDRTLDATLALVITCEPATQKMPRRNVAVNGHFRFDRMSIEELGPWTDGGLDFEEVTPP